jgi:hypothetical protein
MNKVNAIKIFPIILGLAGLGLIWIGPRYFNSIVKETIVAIGQSLLGTGIVGYFIDRAAREEFIKKAAREAIGYIIGKNLPFALQRQIDAIVNTNFVREEFRRIYVLQRLNESQVRLVVETGFVVRNYSADPVSYLTSIDIEEKEHPKFTQLTCYSQHNNEKRYVLQGAELDAPSGRDGVRRAQGKQVKLQAAGSENSAYCFVWDYEITKSVNDSDEISFGTITTDVMVTVKYDPEIFEVDLYSMSNAKRLDGGRWVFDKSQVFFKSQHVILYWKLKAKS